MPQRVSPRKRRIKRDVVLVILVAIGAVVVTWALGGFESAATPADIGSSGVTKELERPVPEDHPRITFLEQARELGIDAVHGAGERRSLLPEDMGPGAALEDLDGDGDLDIFLVNLCAPVGPGTSRSAAPPPGGATHRMFRNDGGRFTEVTAASGCGFSEYGIGVAAGDFDGDGRIDLYVTCYGRNRLLRNLGGLRFEDVTEKAGVGDDGFGAGAAFADLDGDDDLDLYVCNYVDFLWDGEAQRSSSWGEYALPYTINPNAFPPAPNRLYRNRGDGTFEEVAGELGVDNRRGRSLGVTLADFNLDGQIDIYVLNDVSDNAYFQSTGRMRFADRSIECLAADHRGAMGNAVADLEGDGDLDLFITHWIAQENGLYVNLVKDARFRKDRQKDDPCEFMDEAEKNGLGQISNDYVGWGTAFFDYDLDGLLDLIVVNGSTMEEEGNQARLVAQRPQLFWHRPEQGFFDVGTVSGEAWTETWNARGMAEGDIDGDGDLDVVVLSNRGPVRILVHQGCSNGWLRVRLEQPGRNRYAIGAMVSVTAGDRTCVQAMGAGTSYLSHRPLELTFGLGRETRAARVEVRWPDGTTTVLENVAGNQARTIRKSPDGR